MSTRLTLLCCLILLIIAPSFGVDVPTWTSNGPFDSEEVLTTVVDPSRPRTLYAGTLYAGILKSTDSGKTWRSSNRGILGDPVPTSRGSEVTLAVTEILLNPKDTDVLYARVASNFFTFFVAGGGDYYERGAGDLNVYRSDNGGGSWSLILEHVYDLDIDLQNPTVLYAGGHRGALKTTDSGAHWFSIGLDIQPDIQDHVEQIRVSRADPRTLFARLVHSQGGLFRSTDAGANWTRIEHDLLTLSTVDLVVLDPQDSAVVYVWGQKLLKSSDSGSSWRELVLPTVPRRRLEINEGVLYAGRERSVNGGLSWETIFPDLGLIYDVGFDPTLADPAYLCTSQGLFSIKETGQTWTELPLPTPYLTDILVDRHQPNRVLAGNLTGQVFLSADNAGTWEQTAGEVGFVQEFVSTPDGDHLFLLAGNDILESADGGKTWEQIFHYFFITAFAPDPGRPEAWYLGLGTQFEIFGGVDYFLAKKEPDKQPTHLKYFHAISDIEIVPGMPTAVYVATIGNEESGEGFYKSTDSGVTFIAKRTGLETNKIERIFVNKTAPSVVFVVDDAGRLFRSDDGADHWTPVDGGLRGQVREMVADPEYPGIWFAATSSGVFTSANDGLTWKPVQPQLPDFVNPKSIAIAPTVPRTIYVGSLEDGVWSVQVPSGNLLYFPQVGHGQNGIAEIRTGFKFLNTGPDTGVRISFFSSDGQAMPVSTTKQAAVASVVFFPLKHGQTDGFETTGATPLKVGYAKVETGAGVEAAATFTYTENGVVLYRTGVPASTPLTDFSLFVDTSAEGRDTGLALVNPGNAAADLTLRLYDLNFNLLAEKSVKEMLNLDRLPPSAHTARYATEIFPEIREQGITSALLIVQSDVPLAVVTLRQSDTPASFPEDVPSTTVFPVIPNRPLEGENQSGAPVAVHLPQIGDGESTGFRVATNVVLVNTGQEAQAQVELFDSSGAPLTLEFSGLGTGSSFPVVLPKGAARSFRTSGRGTVKVGYARVTAPPSVAATAVFEYWQDDIALFRAGVPSVSSQKRLSFILEKGADRDTGIAIVNTGTGPAAVTFALFDREGNLKASRNILEFVPGFPAGAHLARFADELFPLLGESAFEGFITVTSDERLAAVTLAQYDDPAKGFPEDVYLLTVLPAIAGIP